MLPLLYETTNRFIAPHTMKYIGRITKLETGTSTEERNKDYTVEATVLPTDELIGEIQNQRFILAKPNPTDSPQFFEITDSDFDSIGRLRLQGKHIKHCANNNIIYPDFDSARGHGTPMEHWEFIQDSFALPNGFSFSTNITAQGYIETGYNVADSLGRFFEELAAEYNGEYHMDNFNIRLLEARGQQKPYLLRWDKNIENPQLSLSTADIKSHVVAFGTVKVVPSQGSEYEIQMCSDLYEINGQTSKLNKIFMLDANERMIVKEIADPQISGEYERAKNDLNRIASDYRGEVAGQENVNLRVDYRPLLDEMTAVGLCDTVNVMLKGGRVVNAKITKTTYDFLHERWVSIELGKARLNLADIIKRRR